MLQTASLTADKPPSLVTRQSSSASCSRTSGCRLRLCQIIPSLAVGIQAMRSVSIRNRLSCSPCFALEDVRRKRLTQQVRSCYGSSCGTIEKVVWFKTYILKRGMGKMTNTFRGMDRRRLSSCRMTAVVTATLAMILGSAATMAVPALQIYIEGGVYDDITETWVLTPASPLESFRVWTVGNIAGPGGVGTIGDVKLAVAYEHGATPTITLAGSDTGGFGGWVDPTTASDASLIQTVTDGSVPTLGDGSSLPAHGIYGSGTDWQEFDLGTFDETTSSVADIVGPFPEDPADLGGHINVYEITVTGAEGLLLHIDLYDTVVASAHARFAPFSHDGASVIPAPGAALLALIGFGCVGTVKRRLR